MAEQQVCVKWQGQEFQIELPPSETVAALKRALQDKTQVDVKRQKLIGLKTKAGKPAADESLLSDLSIKPTTKVMMMGQPDAVVAAVEEQAAAAPEVQDDFDLRPEEEAALEVADRPEVQEKLQRRIRSVEVKIITPPRAGKKCLVLDIDYTLFDLGGSAERPDDLARPYLHEFLAACYEHYDLIIWSATSMKWVEVKMRELGVLGNEFYKIVTLLDHAAMLTVNTDKYGVFDCKPLAFIWAKFPEQYTEENTVMLDDLRRNFIMNKQQGLVIRPYKRSATSRGSDRELYHLARYLTLVGPRPSLADLDHRRWEKYLAKHDR